MSKFSRGCMIFLALALFVLLLCILADGDLGDSIWISRLALIAIGLTLAAWFMEAFVNAPLGTLQVPDARPVADMIAFAYTFTFLALALLLMPFGSLPYRGAVPDSGPIRLFEGCALMPAGEAAKPAAAASQASTKWPPGMPACGEHPEDVFTVLVGVGGIVATPHVVTRPFDATACGTRHPAACPPSAFASGNRATTIVYEVRDGFVVPLLVAVLALVGGIVNLMRRLPEYQKRTHPDFQGTDKEPPLKQYETRDYVVFQVLQLVSAPFIAGVAFYAMSPQTTTTAVALAFASGLFSEGILLRLRMLVEGPDKTQAESQASPTAALDISVTDGAGQPVPGAAVALTTAAGRHLMDGKTDGQGRLTLSTLPAGRLKLQATAPAATAAGPAASIDLAPGQRASVTLRT